VAKFALRHASRVPVKEVLELHSRTRAGWKWAVFVIALISTLTLASTGSGSLTVHVAEHDGSSVLVDGDGNALYLFINDEYGESTCVDACEAVWPPVLVQQSPPSVDGAVDPDLVGTIERRDGSRQLTFASWPLYFYSLDTEPLAFAGHGVGDSWFLVDIDDVRASAGQPSTDSADGVEPTFEETMQVGTDAYARTCAACHGLQGRGGFAPTLAGHFLLGNTNALLDTILYGIGDMPAQGAVLSDAEVAAVATFVRNSWGNEHGLINLEEARERRR